MKQDAVMKEAKKQDEIPDSIYAQIPFDKILAEAEISDSERDDYMANWVNAYSAGTLDNYLNEEMMGPFKLLCDDWL